MAIERFDTYVFEKGRLAPFKDPVHDDLAWADYVEQQGFTSHEQVWGHYPDTYIKVNEARPGAATAFQFVATLNLIHLPHHIFVRDLNGLIELLNLVLPLFQNHSRATEAVGDALFGSQGADDPADVASHVR